jgi:hypothetical protein
MLEATGGNFVEGPGVHDLAPIRLALTLVPIVYALLAIKKFDPKLNLPDPEPLKIWARSCPVKKDCRVLLQVCSYPVDGEGAQRRRRRNPPVRQRPRPSYPTSRKADQRRRSNSQTPFRRRSWRARPAGRGAGDRQCAASSDGPAMAEDLAKNEVEKPGGEQRLGVRSKRRIQTGAFSRACMPARRRWHRVKEGRRRLPVRPVPRLDQGPQSRQHRGAAGTQRDLESTSRRQHPPAMNPPQEQIRCMPRARAGIA